jgi:hypothetical protein
MLLFRHTKDNIMDTAETIVDALNKRTTKKLNRASKPKTKPKSKAKAKAKSKPKKKKLESKAKIRRRLMKKWSEAVAKAYDNKCAMCGIAKDLTADKKVVLDAHHIAPRQINPYLRFDPYNGILLCKSHHKFGKHSAHKDMIGFVSWLQENDPDKYKYILDNKDMPIDLEDRDTLYALESKLDNLLTKE